MGTNRYDSSIAQNLSNTMQHFVNTLYSYVKAERDRDADLYMSKQSLAQREAESKRSSETNLEINKQKLEYERWRTLEQERIDKELYTLKGDIDKSLKELSHTQNLDEIADKWIKDVKQLLIKHQIDLRNTNYKEVWNMLNGIMSSGKGTKLFEAYRDVLRSIIMTSGVAQNLDVDFSSMSDNELLNYVDQLINGEAFNGKETEEQGGNKESSSTSSSTQNKSGFQKFRERLNQVNPKVPGSGAW